MTEQAINDLMARLQEAWDERERQLDEDERVALATPHPWPWAEDEDEVGHVWAEGLNLVVKDTYPENARHIARHDPARVLAEVERGRRDIAAKRRILDEADAVREEVRNPNSADHRANARARQFAYRQVLELLAEAEGISP